MSHEYLIKLEMELTLLAPLKKQIKHRWKVSLGFTKLDKAIKNSSGIEILNSSFTFT